MSKSPAQLLGERLEQDPIQAVRLGVATFLLAGINAGGEMFKDPNDPPSIALAQADWLIANTIAKAAER